jgi:hypothetical protein
VISGDDFPRLTAHNHRVTSPPSPDYNCIAWAAGDVERWWQPGEFWPVATPPDDYGIEALGRAFRALGYEDCAGGDPEPGFEKVALYGSSLLYTHAARQLPDGKWTSKLGRSEDIEHDTPDDVAGGIYGEVVQFMRRPSRTVGQG